MTDFIKAAKKLIDRVEFDMNGSSTSYEPEYHHAQNSKGVL